MVTAAEDICEHFLQKLIDQNKINKLIPECLDNIIFKLLENLVFTSEPASIPPQFAPEPVRGILDHLAKGWNMKLDDLIYRYTA